MNTKKIIESLQKIKDLQNTCYSRFDKRDLSYQIPHDLFVTIIKTLKKYSVSHKGIM